MASRYFLYFIVSTLFVFSTLTFHKSPTIINRSSKVLLQSSSSNSTKTVLPPRRRFAIFSSSIHSKLRSYIFYTPIAAAAWQRLGYEAIVVFVGDFTNKSNASSSPQLNATRTFLQRLGVHTIDFQCNISYSVKMSQLVRIFGGFLPERIVNDADQIITTDSDIIPMRKEDYHLQETADGFVYNAFCCGSFQRRNKTYSMYPMSHISLSKRIWRDLLLQSIQRSELLNSSASPNDAVLLSEHAPFSFETVSLYTRQEFPRLYDSNMTKGDAAWYMDQAFSSMLLNDYCEKYPKIQIDKRRKTSLRLDPDLPSFAWNTSKLNEYGDAHAIHDEVFLPFRWRLFRKLLNFLFNSSLAKDFDLYYQDFVLLLKNNTDTQ